MKMLGRLPLVEQSNQGKAQQKAVKVVKWVHTVTENSLF